MEVQQDRVREYFAVGPSETLGIAVRTMVLGMETRKPMCLTGPS